MRKYEMRFFKKTSQVEIKFFSLNILDSEIKKLQFLQILDIFGLAKMDFIGSCYVFEGKKICENLFLIDENIVLLNENKKEKHPFEINFYFSGKVIKKIIRFISEINIPLYIIPVNEENQISKIEILANDREFSFIIFRNDIYDSDSVIAQIRQVLC